MMQERQIPIQYVGPGVRSVPGVGTFQNGTVAYLPAPKAYELAQEEGFVILGPRPAGRVTFRIGHLDPLERPPEQPPEAE